MLASAPAAALDAAALAVTMAFAVVRPRRLPEAVVAVPAAAVVVLAGGVRWPHALDELNRLGPVVGFLSAVLLLAYVCDRDGLFAAAGAAVARRWHRPPALLAAVFGLAAVTTVVLSLDTTVVLLTPVIVATVTQLRLRGRPYFYACTHLANTASLLLPVSNLTNLLAYAVTGLSFGRFAALMALPWLAGVVIEFVAFRIFFADELAAAPANADVPPVPLPVFDLVVVSLTLVGFILTSLAGLPPVWAALAGALVVSARRLAGGQSAVVELIGGAALPFSAFVLALGVIVRGLSDNGLASAVRHLLPHGSSLPVLLAVAAIAALLANLVNNLPAVLALLPVAAVGGVAPVLAVLIGVNVGPNLTYQGSLATLLWRRVLAGRGISVSVGEFTRLGLLTVPAGLLGCMAALWVALKLIGS